MNKPLSFDDLYPGRFIKAGNLHGNPVTLTVKDVSLEELDGEKGKSVKAILSFERTDMQLVLCKLNGLCVRAMFGPNVGQWIGKRITIYPTADIMPMKDGEDCIRIYGSPDLASDMVVPIQFPRRKAFKVTLRRVEPKTQGGAQ